ncbi:MAG: hypothetical protein CL426_00865 [Acidimicrobiaceae bacterium]|nr:hypothetical protein [Acidimicrobiaceae bacterium]|tara:strand:+ start:682 stop:1332 length:651 start_codon:yes stop_codon:yes gene_type:complete
MKKSLTVVLIALLSVACLVTIIIGLSGNTKTAANPDIAEPVSTRIIEAPKGDANAADAAHDKVIEGPSQRLPNAAAGTVTWLPKPGDLIEFGTALYAVDNKPVILMKGSLPMHRDIAYKISDGPDVAQLERNLVDLGHAVDEMVTGDSTDLTVDYHVTPLTVSSIRSWQLSLGLTSTGIVSHGTVIFRPETVQVSELHVRRGQIIDKGSVLSVLIN